MNFILSIFFSHLKAKHLLILLLFFNLKIYGATPTTVKILKANAYKDNTSLLVYKEIHTLNFLQNNIHTSKTEYYNQKNDNFAEMISDYSQNTKVPTYIFKDFRTDYTEGIKVIGKKYFMFRKIKNSQEEIKEIQLKESYFAGQAWHYYIIKNLNKVDFNNFTMKLILPGRLDVYSFQFKKTSHEKNILKIKLEFKSWFLRLFASHFNLSYDTENKKILSFNGISNIQDNNGKTQNVTIIYE